MSDRSSDITRPLRHDARHEERRPLRRLRVLRLELLNAHRAAHGLEGDYARVIGHVLERVGREIEEMEGRHR
jgi:hypothetical protein